ncbi:G2/mitotic-specific cyclin-B2-like [Cimex lectularius]|uniref:G2/mitotic-specific cyclin-B3 n=1 Tax=Cimex lectularius TaxID=79782 RepID=A0A8I6RZB2_CIMLE|nr:G2/mitotic-specific cyclin-B2-like [Cimex lectularius]
MMPAPSNAIKKRKVQNFCFDENSQPKGTVGKTLSAGLLKRKALSNISNLTHGTNEKETKAVCIKKPGLVHQNKQRSLLPVRKKSVNMNKNEPMKIFTKVVPNNEEKLPKLADVEDIDEVNKGNIFYIPEYASDVFKYLFQMEERYTLKKWPLNVNVSKLMRKNVINWLTSINNHYNLLQETIHLAVSLLDRCLSSDNLPREKNLKLIALCCLSIAVKYEEISQVSLTHLLPTIDENIKISDFLQTEREILKTLAFDLARPSTVYFLRRFNMVLRATALQYTFSKFLVDLCLLDSSFCHVKPSLIAATAVFISMCISKTNISPQFWSDNLIVYTTYSYQDIRPVISKMALNVIDSSKQFNSVVEKYSCAEFLCAAQHMLGENAILRKLCLI